MKKLILVIAFVLGLFFVSASDRKCSAAPILDQQSFVDPDPSRVTSTLNYRDIAQTFTVGITGTLTQIDIPILKSYSLSSDPIFDIRRTVGGIPVEDDSDILASIAIPNGSLSDGLPRLFFPIDLNILVTAGDVLAMVLRLPDEPTTNGEVSWSVVFGDQYSRGKNFIRDDAWTGTPWSNGQWSNDTMAVHDLVFRTFIDTDPAPIPEPATVALLGIGLVGLAGAEIRRRRKRKQLIIAK